MPAWNSPPKSHLTCTEPWYEPAINFNWVKALWFPGFFLFFFFSVQHYLAAETWHTGMQGYCNKKKVIYAPCRSNQVAESWYQRPERRGQAVQWEITWLTMTCGDWPCATQPVPSKRGGWKYQSMRACWLSWALCVARMRWAQERVKPKIGQDVICQIQSIINDISMLGIRMSLSTLFNFTAC